ncbi:membrane protein [Dyella jiangningensis]|uniref:DUF423 domain-containing protein n=1 Tax=Dyella jiangningensis TaxID=1379159 RepID=UPI0004565CE2|nr:DUF423 domain-containing protein [Dyella jiangningensis]AHX14063.1 membrane protein [Dyella jiangningensis]MDG2536273.1 DUF423 domain-containing protein [Dyella jiangningensis]
MRHPSSATGVLIGLAGASAVMLGAFGAHALRDVLDTRGSELWHTAVSYHFWHALALVLAVFSAPGRARRVAMAAFPLGVVAFSGSLYALALGAPRWFGAITPLGGVAFMVGWVALGIALTPLLARASR